MSVNPRRYSAGIIGAGLAGRYLAFRLAALGNFDVHLFDKGESRPEHVWGFWDSNQSYLEQTKMFVLADFDNLRFNFPGVSKMLPLKSYTYRAITSSGYEESLLESSARSGCQLVHDTVTEVTRGCDKYSLRGEMTGDHAFDFVFDSRPSKFRKDVLLQHFLGMTVKFSSPQFNPTTAILMDFNVDQSAGLHFMYGLPLSEREALIESTVFSPEVLDKTWYHEQIHTYLKTHVSSDHFQIISTESGALPLVNLESYNNVGIPIGLAAGASRASTGYAFTQIHRQIDSMITHYQSTGSMEPQPGCDVIERKMDDIFLDVIKLYPNIGPEIFSRLAHKLSGDDFCEFMDGYSRYTTRLKVVSALPKITFLRSLANQFIKWN